MSDADKINTAVVGVILGVAVVLGGYGLASQEANACDVFADRNADLTLENIQLRQRIAGDRVRLKIMEEARR